MNLTKFTKANCRTLQDRIGQSPLFVLSSKTFVEMKE
jgi:hypothetical protein